MHFATAGTSSSTTAAVGKNSKLYFPLCSISSIFTGILCKLSWDCFWIFVHVLTCHFMRRITYYSESQRGTRDKAASIPSDWTSQQVWSSMLLFILLSTRGHYNSLYMGCKSSARSPPSILLHFSCCFTGNHLIFNWVGKKRRWSFLLKKTAPWKTPNGLLNKTPMSYQDHTYPPCVFRFAAHPFWIRPRYNIRSAYDVTVHFWQLFYQRKMKGMLYAQTAWWHHSREFG